MAHEQRLSIEEVSRELESLDGWSVSGDSITRKFSFRDFREAMDFVNEVAILSEEAGHHPDISISYNSVTLSLSTHDAGGITRKDI